MCGKLQPWMRYVAVAALPLLAVVASPAAAQSSLAAHTSMNWQGALTGIFFGLLIFSIAYNAAFYAVLRERFLVWQSARALTYFALVVGLSPLAMGPWLEPTSFARQVYINILFDAGIALSAPFLVTYLEPGTVGPRARRTLLSLSAAVMLTTPAMLLPGWTTYMAVRNVVLVALLLTFCWIVVRACWIGSRTARNQVIAWSGIVAVFGTSLFHDIVLHRPFDAFLFALIPAIGLEAILTALGVLDRLNRLRREREEARNAATALAHIAHTDPLTGLPNRRAIMECFAIERPVALALVDLDHFKAVNDAFGHDIGDAVIVAAAQAINSGKAIAARIGGEEYALLFYGDLAYAALEAEALRCRIGNYVAARVPAVSHQVTASLGMTAVGDEMSFATAMKLADINLYAAKGAGRDRLIAPFTRAA